MRAARVETIPAPQGAHAALGGDVSPKVHRRRQLGKSGELPGQLLGLRFPGPCCQKDYMAGRGGDVGVEDALVIVDFKKIGTLLILTQRGARTQQFLKPFDGFGRVISRIFDLRLMPIQGHKMFPVVSLCLLPCVYYSRAINNLDASRSERMQESVVIRNLRSSPRRPQVHWPDRCAKVPKGPAEGQGFSRGWHV